MNLSNKRFLITGAGGFTGSHLVEEPAKKGCKVRAFAHYDSFNSRGWIAYFDLPGIIIEPFNTCGWRQSARGVISETSEKGHFLDESMAKKFLQKEGDNYDTGYAGREHNLLRKRN